MSPTKPNRSIAWLDLFGSIEDNCTLAKTPFAVTAYHGVVASKIGILEMNLIPTDDLDPVDFLMGAVWYRAVRGYHALKLGARNGEHPTGDRRLAHHDARRNEQARRECHNRDMRGRIRLTRIRRKKRRILLKDAALPWKRPRGSSSYCCTSKISTTPTPVALFLPRTMAV